ncbi:MAG: hypothetical protein JWQ63_510 [Mucilaginibacter sp.]|nr:hypothetical protein [Mucilaginibacter sp.]
MTKDLLNSIRAELIVNKKFEEEQYAYHLKVLRSMDSALMSPEIQKQIVFNDEFHITRIAPQGVLYRYLNDVTWEVAKSHDVLSKVNLKTITMLTYIYQKQARIMKAKDEIKVF